jgi:hypothetical protein
MRCSPNSITNFLPKIERTEPSYLFSREPQESADVRARLRLAAERVLFGTIH